MNALDFILFLTIFLILISYKRLSFIFIAISSLFLFVGFAVWLIVTPIIGAHFSKDLHKGLVALLVLALITTLCVLLSLPLGRRAKTRLIPTKIYALDRALTIPSVILASLATLVFLAHSLLYIPILALQFEVQGSTTMLVINKHTEAKAIEDQAKKINANQFKNLTLEYDSSPITTDNLDISGEFAEVTASAAPSVVKVSGNGCAGLAFGSGFVVAPGIIVTNSHVAVGRSSIYVRNQSGAYPATPLIVDQDVDLAILYSSFIDVPALGLTSRTIEADETVVAMGYPGGGDLNDAIAGLSSRSFAGIETKLSTKNTHAIKTGEVVPGNSGGPLLDKDGKVIGVMFAAGGGTAYSIDATEVIQLVEKAKKQNYVGRAGFCAAFKGL